MSLDINLTNVQAEPIVVSSNTTATNDSNYTVVANATFTDPTPVEGKGFKVFVRNGTAVIGGVSYGANSLVFRVFHSGAWANTLINVDTSAFVQNTRTINGQALSSDVVVSLFPLFCLKGISNAATGGTARYITFVDSSNVNATETTQRMIIPIATTYYNFCILTSTLQPATGSSIFTILKNGVDTGIVITIAAGSAAGTFSDTTNSVAFSQFDTVSIKWVNNASTSSCQVTSLSMASK